ncbi:hypothetical protein GAU_2273 [Gemmatimonas aurantiaca T-27]|uniref:Uncharacterized protein n=1 Tax=Gemmatimonas aurantiaca (strain DSM 14586 / JCM 11422 / NBRC 100505 / T-27) TaxID=379066 RepID=C1AAQ9_GEMAT|nr:hypothetical protein [Gemmatimonas aurantiaca]BAH39315.1 hypothetical protein GAU_2273 [Gemmatimonas aurantiaca T-27]
MAQKHNRRPKRPNAQYYRGGGRTSSTRHARSLRRRPCMTYRWTQAVLICVGVVLRDTLIFEVLKVLFLWYRR